MKFGIVVFPGSNCDRDMAWVLQGLLQRPVRMVWHEEHDLSDLDVIVLPGGFSYGDYLRCGAIARFSPAMQATIRHAETGGWVLGVCNGFQILTETGLLPGALVKNRDMTFICDQVPLQVATTRQPMQAYRQGEVITLPIAHGEGSYYADAPTLADLEAHDQILLRYCTTTGETSDAANPNGSLHNIAGICNRQGNVIGMMPHPERASDACIGNTDGIRLFHGLLSNPTMAATV